MEASTVVMSGVSWWKVPDSRSRIARRKIPQTILKASLTKARSAVVAAQGIGDYVAVSKDSGALSVQTRDLEKGSKKEMEREVEREVEREIVCVCVRERR
jgi:hypothetical protein